MNNRIPMDHVVLSRTKPQLDASASALAQPIGTLAETLHVRGRPDEPSEVEALIGAAILEALRERGIAVDGAMHGVFDEKSNFVAGPKTVNDIWNLIPFENYVVTAELTPEEIKTVVEEVYAAGSRGICSASKSKLKDQVTSAELRQCDWPMVERSNATNVT